MSKRDLSYLIMLFVVAAVVFGMVFKELQPVSAEEYLQVTIKEGDTLWELSEQYKMHHNYSNQDFISWVERKNNVESIYLKPGQKIILPVKLDQAEVVMKD
ncbi:LysM peptidoglycan-binding domain-containing protein [Bacillus tianshenii]|nr:LysM peptidoglycan-binding domain-containing protein [Bacillus tianshenii]